MVNVTYNNNIPEAPNNPSADQPKMKTNTNAVDTLFAVDHVSFNTNDGGTHKKTTFIQKLTPAPAAPSDPTAVLFTQDGVDNAAHPQLYYINSQATFPVSALRAFGAFDTLTSPNVPPLMNGYNVASITHPTAATYVITLTTNSINSDNAVVFIYVNSNTVPTYTLVGGVLTISGLNIINGITVNFQILQI